MDPQSLKLDHYKFNNSLKKEKLLCGQEAPNNILSFPYKSGVVSKWSSNASLRKNSPACDSIENFSEQKSFKLKSHKVVESDDSENTTVCSFRSKFSEHNNSSMKSRCSIESCTQRPPTSRSLPIQNASSSLQDESMQFKNPSCPNIIPPSASSSLVESKSNLDYFIDLTSNPFTTKFEILGSSPRKQRSIKSKGSGKRVASIKGLSVSQMNLSEQRQNLEHIVSPSNVSTFTQNIEKESSPKQAVSYLTCSASNNSANNLFRQNSPGTCSIYDGNFSPQKCSVSDENLDLAANNTK